MSASVEQFTVSILRSTFFDNCVLMAAIASYTFDRCICSGREIDLIWSRGYSLVSALYALLTALTIIELCMWGVQNLMYLDCKLTSVGHRGTLIRAVPDATAGQAITASYDALIAVIAALRVYAINDRDWRLSALVFLLLILRSAYDLFEGINLFAVNVPPPIGCVDGVASPVSNPCQFFIASMAASMAADAMVFIVTWRRTYHVVRGFRQVNIKTSLNSLLLRDGAIYFMYVLSDYTVPVVLNSELFIRWILIVNCIVMITNLAPIDQRVPDSVTIPISTILLSRMLLNLREAGLRTNVHGAPVSSDTLGASQSATISDLDFSPRGVDAFGASWNDDEGVGMDEGEIVDNDELELEMMGSETTKIGSAEP
ncbi:hypothetical protein EVJ58_g2805 [Rhodofomes roseus]|uniref:Uncharacterized protein n=1 Tax=Rhodofomes roseus TaxID=34475 RepID=A0A4Y9YST9_9APHY|nr:hypothetical protein EVJ58_g2805 [Rhodofomes roseus]